MNKILKIALVIVPHVDKFGRNCMEAGLAANGCNGPTAPAVVDKIAKVFTSKDFTSKVFTSHLYC